MFSLENCAILIFEYSTNCDLVYFAFGPITHRIIFELPRDLRLKNFLHLQLGRTLEIMSRFAWIYHDRDKCFFRNVDWWPNGLVRTANASSIQTFFIPGKKCTTWKVHYSECMKCWQKEHCGYYPWNNSQAQIFHFLLF